MYIIPYTICLHQCSFWVSTIHNSVMQPTIKSLIRKHPGTIYWTKIPHSVNNMVKYMRSDNLKTIDISTYM